MILFCWLFGHAWADQYLDDKAPVARQCSHCGKVHWYRMPKPAPWPVVYRPMKRGK